jgi:YesN/AraC family two-component response regulator
MMKTILFVDDEPRILDGLKRMLRSRRGEWTLLFAPSAQDALTTLEAREVDAVVSDIRMPGMDGIELLTKVRDRFPAISRIFLSGYSDHEQSDTASAVAHRFISKPCEARDLIDTIEVCLRRTD